MITVTITTPQEKETVIAIGGELDSDTASQFSGRIESVVKNADGRITLDFSALNYISSAGLRSMLLLKKNADARGGSVVITGMSEEIRQIFQLTGFDTLFVIQ